MCGLSEFRVTDNELTLCGELARPCLGGLGLTSEDHVRRYAADFARLALPVHECGEGRIELHGDRRLGVAVRLRMMAVGVDVGHGVLDLWSAPTWGSLLTRETAPARLYDRAGDDRQGEDERGRGLGPGVETHRFTVEDDGSMTVTFWKGWG